MNVSILFPITAFSKSEVFKKVVEHYAFDDIGYHSICYYGDFLNVSARVECLSFSCKQCRKSDQCKDHSCLLRLVWLLFNRDDRIVSILKNMNGLT